MRSRFEIIQIILLLASGKKSKTSILYGANLSFNQLHEYFTFLLDTNLLSSDEVDGKTCYKTTAKGYRFLECFQEIQDFLRNDEDENVASPTKLDIIFVSRKH